ncbi:MAG TPA: TIGR03086 family metal-binding protein [Acidimicrobiales bacterium]|nr:TIGR03086 family metal-binding protein [Acidimicrobiales bacterium]
MDTINVMKRVIGQTQTIVDRVSPDELAKPTPCAEWTVRDVINHITGGATMFAECISDGSIADERMAKLFGGDNLGDDYKGAFKQATDKVIATFAEPGMMDKMVRLPFGEMPAGIALNIAVFDVTTHAADLAWATGQAIDDTDLLETALAVGREIIGPDMRKPGMFDPEQEVDASAGVADRLLAFAGRTV